MNTPLIDSYVFEVGRRLPPKTRRDIEAELRSTLEDMLEERSRKTGKPVDEQMTLEVLKEYGAPDKVAATYAGERYLIGPQLYPIFMLVLRIVLIVTGVLAAIGLGVSLYQAALTPQGIFDTVLKAILNFGAALLTALGNIVLIFAILEWALYRVGNKGAIKGLPKEKEWDPRSLLKLSTPNRIKLGEIIGEIVGSFAAIVLFNFYPEVFGIWASPGGAWFVGLGGAQTTPLLSQAFFAYVPYLTALWILTILLDIYLLRLGYWNIPARAVQIGLKVISIVIAARMLAGPSLLAVTAATLTPAIGSPEAANTLMLILTTFVKVALWLSIVGSAVEIARAIARMLSKEVLPVIPAKS